ncbi:hypothetical protein PPS11_39638 [Pseudomonas putida S11]|nr:hypothetical protein PPS11_39638 [Pseudomonas putida S11]
MPRGVGSEHVVGLAKALGQHGRQVQRTVEALAVQLAQPLARLLGVAQEHKGLGAIHRVAPGFRQLPAPAARLWLQASGSATSDDDGGRMLATSSRQAHVAERIG